MESLFADDDDRPPRSSYRHDRPKHKKGSSFTNSSLSNSPRSIEVKTQDNNTSLEVLFLTGNSTTSTTSTNTPDDPRSGSSLSTVDTPSISLSNPVDPYPSISILDPLLPPNTDTFLSSLPIALQRDPEKEEGSFIEYKFALPSMYDSNTLERRYGLSTQLRWRLREGSGYCIYYLGMQDGGYPLGSNYSIMKNTLYTLYCLALDNDSRIESVRWYQGKKIGAAVPLVPMNYKAPLLMTSSKPNEITLVGEVHIRTVTDNNTSVINPSSGSNRLSHQQHSSEGIESSINLSVPVSESLIDHESRLKEPYFINSYPSSRSPSVTSSNTSPMHVRSRSNSHGKLGLKTIALQNDVRILVVGSLSAGKSTFISCLTRGVLDDGKGSSRLYVMRHRHEIECGNTSSYSYHTLGFTSDGAIVNHGHDSVLQLSSNVQSLPNTHTLPSNPSSILTNDPNKQHHPDILVRGSLSSTDIIRSSASMVTFIDSANYSKYKRNILHFIVGSQPHLLQITLPLSQIISILDTGTLDNELVELFSLIEYMGKFVYILITKCDLFDTVDQASIRQTYPSVDAVINRFTELLEIQYRTIHKVFLTPLRESIVPINCINGYGLRPVVDLIVRLSKIIRAPESKEENTADSSGTILSVSSLSSTGATASVHRSRFTVQEVLTIDGNTILMGLCTKGLIRKDCSLFIGPLYSTDRNAVYEEVTVRSIQIHRLTVNELMENQFGTLHIISKNNYIPKSSLLSNGSIFASTSSLVHVAPSSVSSGLALCTRGNVALTWNPLETANGEIDNNLLRMNVITCRKDTLPLSTTVLWTPGLRLSLLIGWNKRDIEIVQVAPSNETTDNHGSLVVEIVGKYIPSHNSNGLACYIDTNDVIIILNNMDIIGFGTCSHHISVE